MGVPRDKIYKAKHDELSLPLQACQAPWLRKIKAQFQPQTKASHVSAPWLLAGKALVVAATKNDSAS